ncbi:MAG TPA: hypothetical protein PLA09_06095 [Clostridia bacterium]|nr:hypothetical protein [Clostridia bacterium]
MANYPDKIVVSDKGVVTPYLKAYGSAFAERFGISEDRYYDAAPVAPVEAAPAEEPVYAAPVAAPKAAPAAKCGYKKCNIVIAIVLFLSLLIIAFAAISYIGIDSIKDYTTIYGGNALDVIIDDVIALFGADAQPEILDYIIPIALLASLVVAFCIFVSSIAGLASRNRIMLWIAALLMFLLTVASAVCYYFSLSEVEITDFIMPGGDYLQIGFFVLLGLQLVTLIVSCFANSKVRAVK